MKRFEAIGASDGIAIGTARMLAASVVVVDRRISSDQVKSELLRLEEAVAATDEQLAVIGRQLESRGEHEGQLIVDCHRLILRSNEIVGGARKLISGEGLAVESAVRRVVDGIAATFEKMRNPYLRERGGDIEAVGERLLGTLLGLPDVWSSSGMAGSIGVGSALSPIDAFHLKRIGLAGLVTEGGGKTSHAAIIVRALKLPYVLAVRGLCASVRPGDTLIVDGTRGEVIVNPDSETRAAFEERRRGQLARVQRLRVGRTGATTTIDGVRVEIGANIEVLSEIASAVELGAESVGLVRTELLYLDRPDLPTEDEQYRDALATLAALGGRVATFRTLDIGGEKLPLGAKVPPAANPGLGVRAIRFSLRRPDIFRAQLRALYRASAMGPMRIMFPLVAGVGELSGAQKACAEVRDELSREGIAYRPDVPIGAMIETPSAALTADHLARSCDFFSVGTNDLVQYAFAADRGNPDVCDLYRPLHPAMLRLLKLAIDAVTGAGKPISVCGDMAGDPTFTWVLLGLGIRQFSMAACGIPAVRSVIAGTRLAEAQELVASALRLGSDQEVEELVLGTMRKRFPLELATEGNGVEPTTTLPIATASSLAAASR